jgi:hypothetical protein
VGCCTKVLAIQTRKGGSSKRGNRHDPNGETETPNRRSDVKRFMMVFILGLVLAFGAAFGMGLFLGGVAFADDPELNCGECAEVPCHIIGASCGDGKYWVTSYPETHIAPCYGCCGQPLGPPVCQYPW